MLFQGKYIKQQGAALLIVIMITAIMSIIMTLMLHQSRLDMKLASLIKQRALAEVKLEDAQANFIYNIMTSPLHLVGPKYVSETLNFEPLVSDFKGTISKKNTISISIQDLSGLVSILPLDESNLNKLLLNHGYTGDDLLTFKDKLEDWQDSDSLTRLEGKEIGDYKSYPFFPSNMLIQNVAELSYILGPTIYNHIKSWLVL